MIVAIGRALGAGGRDVGVRVAALLGAELLDKQIVDLVAARMGAPASYVEALDEHGEGFVDRLFRTISAAYPESFATTNAPDWSEERLVKLTASIIEEHADDKPLVVIGRGAPVLLRDRHDVVRILVTGSPEERAERVALRTGKSHDEAVRDVKSSDQARSSYMQSNYGVDWRNPLLYDLVVNTDRIGVEDAAHLVVSLKKTPLTP